MYKINDTVKKMRVKSSFLVKSHGINATPCIEIEPYPELI